MTVATVPKVLKKGKQEVLPSKAFLNTKMHRNSQRQGELCVVCRVILMDDNVAVKSGQE